MTVSITEIYSYYMINIQVEIFYQPFIESVEVDWEEQLQGTWAHKPCHPQRDSWDQPPEDN